MYYILRCYYMLMYFQTAYKLNRKNSKDEDLKKKNRIFFFFLYYRLCCALKQDGYKQNMSYLKT